MSNQFSASTPVNIDNLNALIRGDGSLKGIQLFSLFIIIYNNVGTMQYKLYTNSSTGGWKNLTDIGASEQTSYTNMGDGNVDRNGAGDYKITGLNVISNIFAIGQIINCSDSNITVVKTNGVITTSEIAIKTYTAAGALAEIASTKDIQIMIFGFFN